MSAAHVELLNRLLGESLEFREFTAKLSCERVLTYQLSDGPGGETVYWTVRTGPQGTRFSLRPPDRTPDVIMRARWPGMIRAARASRLGERYEVAIEVQGDASVLACVERVLEAARKVATVDCEFPELNEESEHAC
jgi:hypothetical protein